MADSTEHHFTGQERDTETVLDHFQYREYASSMGRWMRPDPAGLGAVDPTNPQSWNQYAYVLGNPTTFIDLLGMDCDDNDEGCEPMDPPPPPPMLPFPQIPDPDLPSFVPSTTIDVIAGFDPVPIPSLDPFTYNLPTPTPGGAPRYGTIICTVNAHGVANNLPTRAPNRPGAYGVPETQGTAAIDRSQWLPPGGSTWTSAQQNAYVAQYRSQISGYVPNGNGGYAQVFNSVSDNMGPASGVALLVQRYPNRVLFELPGGQDLGNVNGMQFQVPSAIGCPHP